MAAIPRTDTGYGWGRPRRPVVKVPLEVVGLALALSVLGTAVAMSLLDLPVERLSLFRGQVASTDFVVDAFESKPKGMNRVDVSITLRNGAGTAHTADVTVQLLDAAGALLVEDVKPTGSVAGGASANLAYTFTQSGLTGAYHSAQVLVRQGPENATGS